MRKSKSFACVMLLCALLFAAGAAGAEEWPSKPIQLIVSFAAGGGSDLTARTLAPFLSKELGQSVVVVNKPGASGEIGHRAVATAKPDGYTLGMANLPPMLTLPIERDTGFTLDSFTLIGNLIVDPSALSVLNTNEVKDLKSFMDFARKNPGKATIGFTGVGTDDHLWMVYFMKETGLKITPVPFDGAGPVRTSMLGGHVMGAALNLGEAMPHKDSIRVLAHMDNKRSPLAPDVPTMTEQGVNVIMRSERGLIGPKGLPPEVTKKLCEALKKVAGNPELKEKIEAQYTVLDYIPPEEWIKQLREQDKKLRDLWRENPWKTAN